ncbi:MAG: hypothetical protein ACTSSG_12415 [Candidatus Heimdallarchaeaceae archaeon]
MKKRILFSLVILILSVLLANAITSSQASSSCSSNSLTIYVEIENAFYCDLENTGVENDIFSEVFVSFDSNFYYNHLYMYLDLELPSGEYFSYLISLHFYGINAYTLSISLFDHALETGYYTLYVLLFFANNHDNRYATSTLIFDPPGSHDDSGDPPNPTIDIY